MAAYTENLVRKTAQNFNIIEEFSALTPRQKMMLWEHMDRVGRVRFDTAVLEIWPYAQSEDVHKLQKFMTVLQRSLQLAG